jgi:membrane fusion protein, multidrug efflux system
VNRGRRLFFVDAGWRVLAILPLVLIPACAKKVAPAAPPPEVKVATVLKRDVPIYLEGIGQTRGNTETDILARVEGFITKVQFQEGTWVKKGQVLYALDRRPLEASLEQAKGTLAYAEADWARTKQDVARFEPLVADNAVSRQEYETAVALEKASKAAVAAARAAERRAAVELGYTTVEAPDDGLIGKTEVQTGTLVGRGSPTLLTRISKIDPIHVRFTLAEKDYLRLARAFGVDKPPKETKDTLDMILADGSVHPYKGSVVFVDRNVNPETGTILVEASFPNPEKIVRPGQYARVRGAVQVKTGAILVPQRAVQELQGNYSVAVVKADETIELRPVKASDRVGSLWVIDSGLEAGDRIVVEGLQKVRPGVKVSAVNVTIDEADATNTQTTTAPGA